MRIVCTSTDAPGPALIQAVGQGLDDHNLLAAPSLVAVQPLAASATDTHGQLVGGALGRTWGRCCELQELWVAAASRRAGIGAQLLRTFEDHAGRRGCTVFYLTTLSYQAPAFYERHGYRVIASIDGYPDGIVKSLMHKTQAGGAAGAGDDRRPRG